MELPRLPDELRRLDALRAYQSPETPAEPAFDDLAELAAHICETPIALIAIIGESRVWCKSTVGWPLEDVARELSFSAHAILQRDVFVVPDACLDPRFADNPHVTGDPHIRFYAGAPLVTAEGYAVGTLGVMDRVPRRLTESQRDALKVLGRQVIAQLDVRRRTRELAESEARLRLVTETSLVGLVVVNEDHEYLYANRAYADILGLASPAVPGQRMANVLGTYETQIRQQLDRAFAGERVTRELWKPAADGGRYYAVTHTPAAGAGSARLVVVVITDITQPKLAAIAASRLAAIVESSDDAIIGKDVDGVITSWNRGAERMFGYAADEMVGTSILRLIPPDRLDEEDVILEKIRRGESVWRLETVRRTKAGRLLDVSITSSPIRDTEGRTIGASKVARDITERKRAEGALREREEQLRLYAEHSPVAVAMFDRDMTYLVASGRWMKDYGLGDRSIVGRRHYDMFPDLPPRWVESHQRCLAGAVEKCDEDPFPRADGSVRWLRRELQPWRKADGSIGGIIIFSEDITERKETLEAVRTAEERTRFALQHANVGIWDMDYPTGVLRWSETLEAHYGLAPGTFGGTFEAFAERVHPDDRARLLEGIGKAAQSGVDFTTEHRALWADGTVRWLRGAGRVLLGDRGEPVRGVGISLDVTDGHTLEAQFQQAQKMEAVGRLAGGIAHDFNNLLFVILGYCELLQNELRADDPLWGHIARIQKAGVSAAALTRQLLAFSRKEIIEPTLLDLNAVMSGMRGMLGRLIGEDVAVLLRLSAAPAMVMADSGQVEQIVLNLAVNARDAMPLGGTLTIETAHVELDEHYLATHFAAKPGAYVALTVSDTGTGMTPDAQTHLFEPFFTTKEAGKGTGLGLATVHGVVSRSGGSIRVYSELGRGSSFTVYLPRADAASLVVESLRPALSARGAPGTVLVVEDSDAARELTQRLLERQGYKVLVAANAAQALQMFEQHATIDLLLTDVVMPGASGPELTRQLLEQRPLLRVIYMSGYTEDAIVQHGVLKPGVVLLHKPFTQETLARKISEVLDTDAVRP